MDRRTFIKQTGMATAALGMTGTIAATSHSLPKNKLPKWKGFNLLDFFSPDPAHPRHATTIEELDWIRDWGFNFVRIPIAYPAYLDIDHTKPITPDQVYALKEEAVEKIDQLVAQAHARHLHVSLNLHRAPGYCINAGFHEPYNLWTDPEALDAFCYHWNMWAARYKNTSREKISFDLVNEPTMREDMNDQFSLRTAVPEDLYRKVAKAALETIRKQNPDHLVIADGNNGGNTVVNSLKDLDIAQSCRGYAPAIISHYKAPWVYKETDTIPTPKWPGQVGDTYLSRALLEELYAPWIALLQEGIGVHCGECGCYNKTPHDVFLAWFNDLLDILNEHGIGFGLWEFSGAFGVMDSGRTDVTYEDWYGRKLDRKFLQLLLKY